MKNEVYGCKKVLAHRPAWLWLTDYNCGGYALRTFDWVGFRFPHSRDNASQQVDAICAALPEWERCDCPQKFDTKHYDYVAFRWGKRKGWNDFHFLRLWRNGTWHGKEGDGEIYRVKDVFEPWVRSDGEIYGEEIFFLRRKRKTKGV